MKNFSFKSFTAGILTAVAVMTPVLAIGAANSQTIDVIFGKIKLTVNGNAINEDTLLYNGTTYLPIRAVGKALNAEVNYDAAKYEATITMPDTSASTYWANKVYILATEGNIDANKLIISNVTASDFNFEFRTAEDSILKGKANITNYTAVCNVSDIYGLKFEIHGDEITVYETGKAQLFPTGSAAYVHKTAMQTVDKTTKDGTITNTTTSSYTDFKAGKYSNGSSDMAKTLIISEVKNGEGFKYQVIAANGKDVITEGTAKITMKGNAECVFSDDYKITLKSLSNNVIELKESKQTLFPLGGIKFYTI